MKPDSGSKIKSRVAKLLSAPAGAVLLNTLLRRAGRAVLTLILCTVLYQNAYAQPEYPSLIFYLYINHPGQDEYKIESFQLMSDASGTASQNCLQRDTNTRYHNIFTFKPHTNIYRYELYNNYYYRIVITHQRDTMVIDFMPYGQSLTYHYYIDTIRFLPGYFEYDVEKAPNYKVSGGGNYHKGITCYLAKNTPWLNQYKLPVYRQLITPCTDDTYLTPLKQVMPFTNNKKDTAGR
jgi:hypothetical protein